MIALTKKIVGYSVKKPTPQEGTKLAVVLPPTPVTASSDPDRRIVLKRAVGLAERSLRFAGRPRNANGFTAWTSDFFRVPAADGGRGHKFAIAISHYVNGVTHPFEVWALGREEPPMASMICELLSKVLQTNDPPFIQYHLNALKKAGGRPFEITVPHTGVVEQVGSFGAALAVIVEAHARHIGYLTEQSLAVESQMLQAMTSMREPKTEGLNGFGSYQDVNNKIAKHDFTLWLKEAMLPDGSALPISLWFAGDSLPPESSALCKLASLAMRHSDAKWVSMFLQTLRKDYDREQEFWAPVPGTDKQACYGSTWAFVAEWLLYRYRTLEILGSDGEPLGEGQGQLFADDVELLEPAAATSGLPCKECGEKSSVYLASGCLTCVSCGHSKCS